MVKFWGVRGSCPTPLTNQKLQSKIASIVQRIEYKDIQSQESRERFLANLPSELFGTVGGNTTCLEVRLSNNTLIILDAGSGIRELAAELKKRREKLSEIHLFFTHFHWDHLQGLPFFTPAYDRNVTINMYNQDERFESYLRNQMIQPHFPIVMEAMSAKIHYHILKGSSLEIGGAKISYRKMKHPGSSTAYKVTENGKTMIFSTDTELMEEDFQRTQENIEFFQGADILIMDSQYTLDEAIEKYNWGHSSYSLAVDFANEWEIKKLILFHHEPMYDDKKMHSILNSARWYLTHLENDTLKIYLALEGMELEL